MVEVAKGSTQPGFTRDDELEVYRLAASAFGVDARDLGPGSDPETVKGWDSFAHIDFLVALEKAFAVRLSPKDVMTVRTLGDAVAILKRMRE
jgi:acyl carrier protein